jgi:hypothetical protein
MDKLATKELDQLRRCSAISNEMRCIYFEIARNPTVAINTKQEQRLTVQFL